MCRFNIVALCFALAACGAAQDSGQDSIELTDETVDEKADSAASGNYYSLQQDLRECVFPACGGLFVKRVNFATTRCADGTNQPQCYVAYENYQALGLNPADSATLTDAIRQGRAILRGKIKSKTPGNFAELVATEAWLAAGSSAPDGTFYRVADTGIRCIKAPCPNQREFKLNSTVSRTVNNVKLDGIGASEEALDAVQSALWGNTEGALIAGKNATLPQSLGLTLVANQAYTRLKSKSCPPVCTLYCANGFKLDASGCATCSCNPDPVCPNVLCTLFCSKGFKKDAKGCEICDCEEDRTPAIGHCVRNSNDACTTDADCGAGGCGGELCYGLASGSGISACNCTTPPGVSCGCVAGKCSWYN